MKERLCHCGGTMKTIRSSIDREVSGKKVTIKNVPFYNVITVKKSYIKQEL